MEIDSHVETSEEIEELTNQQIFDLSMQRDEEEEGVKFLWNKSLNPYFSYVLFIFNRNTVYSIIRKI